MYVIFGVVRFDECRTGNMFRYVKKPTGVRETSARLDVRNSRATKLKKEKTTVIFVIGAVIFVKFLILREIIPVLYRRTDDYSNVLVAPVRSIVKSTASPVNRHDHMTLFVFYDNHWIINRFSIKLYCCCC